MRSRANTTAAMPYARSRISAIQHFIYLVRAVGANGWVFRMRAHVGGVLPAALALHAGGAFHFYAQIAVLRTVQIHLRNDEQPGQLAGVLFEERIEFAIGRETHAGFERRADQFFIA